MNNNDTNSFVAIFEYVAEELDDAPYASRLARLARTAKDVPDALLDDVAELIVRLDDVQLVVGDVAIALLDVGYCDKRYHDAFDFADALKRRLERYLQNPDEAARAR